MIVPQRELMGSPDKLRCVPVQLPSPGSEKFPKVPEGSRRFGRPRLRKVPGSSEAVPNSRFFKARPEGLGGCSQIKVPEGSRKFQKVPGSCAAWLHGAVQEDPLS